MTDRRRADGVRHARSPDEIEPYYTDIRRGRPPTAEQLADLTRRYDAIGGMSPLAERTEAQRDGLQAALDERRAGRRTSVALGLKHADPTIEDGVDALAAGGVERIVGARAGPALLGDVGRPVPRPGRRPRPTAPGCRSPASRAGPPSRRSSTSSPRAVAAGLAAMPREHAGRVHRPLAARADPRRRRPVPRRAATPPPTPSPSRRARRDWAIAWQSAGRTPEPWIGPDILAVDRRLRRRSGRRAARVRVRLRRRPPRGALRPRHRGPPARRGRRPAVRPHARRQRRSGGDRRARPTASLAAAPLMARRPRRRRRHHRAGDGRTPSPACGRDDRHRAVGGRPIASAARSARRRSPASRRRRRRRRVPRPRAARDVRSPATSGSATISRRRPMRIGRRLARRPAPDPRRDRARRAGRHACRSSRPRCCRGAASCAPRSSRSCRARDDDDSIGALVRRASATRSTSGSSTPSSAASTRPTPTTPAWPTVPQLAELAGRGRSLLLAARRHVRAAAAAGARTDLRRPASRHRRARRRRRQPRRRSAGVAISTGAPRRTRRTRRRRVAGRRRALRRRRAGDAGRGDGAAARRRRARAGPPAGRRSSTPTSSS